MDVEVWKDNPENTKGDAETKSLSLVDLPMQNDLDRRLKDLQRCCLKDAKKYWTKASSYESKCVYLEHAAACLGLLALATVAMKVVIFLWNAAGDTEDLYGIYSQMGILDFKALFIAGTLLIFGQNFLRRCLPYKERANEHLTIAATLQHLDSKIAVTRIHLQATDADETQAESMYKSYDAQHKHLTDNTLENEAQSLNEVRKSVSMSKLS